MAAGYSKLNNPGMTSLARAEMGHSLLVLGRYDEAIDALQEAGALLTTGELGPYAAGMTLCGLIQLVPAVRRRRPLSVR